MAAQLADVATAAGHTVSILSTSPITGDSVAPRWDREVLPHRTSFEQWARRQKTILWFDCQPEKLRLTQKFACRNLLLLLWHRLCPEDLGLLGLFTRVIAPTRQACEHTLRNYAPGNYVLARWDTLTPFSRPPEFDGLHRVFVPLDSRTARQSGPLLLHALSLVAASHSDVHFTIGQSRHWSRCSMQVMTETLRAQPRRFTLVRRRSWPEWCELIAGSSWLFNPTLQENALLTPLVAGYSRVPVIAFDVPPAGDLLRDGKNAVLVPCELRENHWGVPTAEPRLKDLVDVLNQTIGNRQLGFRLTDEKQVGRLRTRRTLFREFWENELEKTDPWA